MIIRGVAHPRAGLVGNPSDGYHGKTISFIIRDFRAEVTLWESPELEILPAGRDHSRFGSLGELVRDVRQFGYYGGIRLLKATLKRFWDHCERQGIALPERNFTLRYTSDIPGQVGLAGSSAIITACLRALMAFYGVTIPKPVQANLVLSVETGELGIPAGLQDRVIQVYEGVVYMDFAQGHFERQGFGRYEELDPGLLPPLYIAYRTDLAEGTEVFHNDIRGRYNRGEAEVVEAMHFWADLAEQVKELLLAGRGDEIGPLLDANFDRRRALYRLSEGNIRMVETARRAGASAKFTGSGGAIVGVCPEGGSYARLERDLGAIGVRVFRPTILRPAAA